MRLFLALIATVALVESAQAQNLTGVWQGTTGSQQHVLKIAKDSGLLRGDFFNLGPEAPGETLSGNPISSISTADRSVKFDLDRSPGSFEGTLSGDGQSLIGQWTTRGKPEPLTLIRSSRRDEWVIDPSRHKVHFVPVETNVQLEVLDWGGEGPALVFVPGHGNTSHVFDALAEKFTAKHHVYAITRRGFGLSSWPAPVDENYDADRLGDDVLAVIKALNIEKPVLAGHSLGGEELSSVGSRHPERIRGLIYLDGAFPYAFYDESANTLSVDISIVRRNLLQMTNAPPSQMKVLIEELQKTMPRLQDRLTSLLKQIEGRPDSPKQRETLRARVSLAIFQNMRKYTDVKVPILSLVAYPKECGDRCGDESFESAHPTARVVRLPHANHYVWRSNETDVIREMNRFLDALPG